MAKLMEYCVQIGLSIRDVDLLTIGVVNDMYAENRKKYKEIATHKDFAYFDEQNINFLKCIAIVLTYEYNIGERKNYAFLKGAIHYGSKISEPICQN